MRAVFLASMLAVLWSAVAEARGWFRHRYQPPAAEPSNPEPAKPPRE